jgi:hypothetical protein
VLDSAGDRVDRITVEQHLPGEHLVQDDGEREHVAATVHRLVLHLLGRHVRRLALHRAELGDGRLSVLDEGDAEIDDLHVAVEPEHQVVGADVAVDETEEVAGGIADLVRGVQTASGLGDRARGDRRRQRCIRERAQRVAGDVLHHHVQRARLLAKIVHGRDARVVDAREDRGLVEEHRAHGGRLGVLGADRLDRDELLERAGPALAPEQHRTHAAGLQLVQDLVGAEPGRHSASLSSPGRSTIPCL